MKRFVQVSILINILGIFAACVAIYSVGGISNLIYKLQSKHVIAKMDNRISQFSNSNISNDCVVFLGDSITEYGEWSELFPTYNILNRGIAGDGILGVSDRLEEIARHQPKMLFLMIGINDLSFHEPAFVISAYSRLLRRIQEQLPTTQVIVQSILPVNNNIYNLGIDNKIIDQVNEAIHKSCIALDLPFLDLNTDFKDLDNNLKSTFTSDGIHINGIAYNTWKEKLNHWFPIK